jgi:MoxR-like ATPase
MNSWELFNKVVGTSERILLYGIPGTGKTYQATKVNVPQDKDVYSTTLTIDSTASEMIGHYIPNDTGTFDWNDGVAIKAWREGTRLVINEIDHAGPDVSSVLHAILDDADIARLTLPNKKKETVTPSKGFSVIATMNGTPDMLPEALADRFGVKININSVHPDAIKSLPEQYQSVYSERDENDIPVSIRAWKEFSKLVDAGVDLRSSATVCFGNDYAEDVVDAIELQDV